MIYPNRLLVVDVEAGQNDILKELQKKLKKRPKGEVSRLSSDAPYLLVDNHRRDHDYWTEDPVTVEVCANGDRPKDFPRIVASRAYPDLATAVGCAEGSARISPRAAKTSDAEKWARIVKGIRKRWGQLQPTLGPF